MVNSYTHNTCSAMNYDEERVDTYLRALAYSFVAVVADLVAFVDDDDVEPFLRGQA